MSNGQIICSCPGFTYKGRCKHLSPADVMRNKRQASKAGKAIAPLLASKYPSNQSKIEADPELAKFLEQTK